MEDVAALVTATRNDNIVEVRRLLDKGTPTHTRDSAGHSILHIALLEGNADIAKLLIERNADISFPTYEGYQPIHFAAGFCPAVVPLLIKKGANANVNPSLFTRSPLEFAIQSGNVEGVAALIEGGANVNMPTPHKKTALHKAVAINIEPIVKVLLDHGADIDKADTDGTTALHIAVTRDIDILALLLERGANTRAMDARGRTPLHVAANIGRTEAAALLLAISPELAEIPDSDGDLPQLENCAGIEEAVLHMASTTVAKFAARRRLKPTVGWHRQMLAQNATSATYRASAGSSGSGSGSTGSGSSGATGNSNVRAVITIENTPSQKAGKAARNRLAKSKTNASGAPRRRKTRSQRKAQRMSRKQRETQK